MKLPNYNEYSRINRANQAPREPLYTLPEIADRLGVEYDILRNYVRGKRPTGCPPPPNPSMITGGSSPARMRTQLYKLSEYKAWWKLRQGSTNKETP
jgi:hypothetical protein